MIIPTVHLNGTSREELLAQIEEAHLALGNAYAAMKRAAPNGRDYYPQGPAALEQATQEHLARLRKVDEVKDELEALAIAIDQQGR